MHEFTLLVPAPILKMTSPFLILMYVLLLHALLRHVLLLPVLHLHVLLLLRLLHPNSPMNEVTRASCKELTLLSSRALRHKLFVVLLLVREPTKLLITFALFEEPARYI